MESDYMKLLQKCFFDEIIKSELENKKVYRTKTYIAADWDEDKDAVDKLKEFNNSKHWGLDFHDVHEEIQARDTSLYCSIKKSLKQRLDMSKTFILIVGKNTINIRKGGCQYCNDYNCYNRNCKREYTIDYRSYIDFECEKAKEAYDEGKMKIIVLYKFYIIHKEKCPSVLKNIGIHIPFLCENGYNYQAIKNAFDSIS